jgi:hypothetical protein
VPEHTHLIEANYCAQMRIARFLGDALAEREAIRKSLKAAYSMRSGVHGGPTRRRGPGAVAQSANVTVDLLRRALRRWMEPDPPPVQRAFRCPCDARHGVSRDVPRCGPVWLFVSV